MKKLIAIILLLTPSLAFAQVYGNVQYGAPVVPPQQQYSQQGGLRDINGVAQKATYIGDLVIGLAIALAVVWIIINVIRYLIAGGEEDRKKGGMAILYGVIGLFVILSIWGLVSILTGTFRFAQNQKPSFENIKISKPTGI